MVVANRAVVHNPLPQHRPDVRPQTRPRPGIGVRISKRVVAGFFVMGLSLLVIFQYGQIHRTNIQNQRLESNLRAIHDEQRHLELTISQLTNPQRLEKIGYELGLMYPAPSQIVYVSNHD